MTEIKEATPDQEWVMEMLNALKAEADIRGWNERPPLNATGKQVMAAITKAEAALAARPVPSTEGWRDIASAPKDGTEILLFVDGMVIQARYSPGYWSDDTPFGPAEYTGPIWSAFDDALQFEIEETPEGDWYPPVTHWQPLPSPPSEDPRS